MNLQKFSTIYERIGELQTGMKLSQTELSEKTGIPISVISRLTDMVMGQNDEKQKNLKGQKEKIKRSL